MQYAIRRARTKDVRAIRALIDANVASGRLLDKATVTLYEDIQEFWVACGPDDRVVGCGALHVMWEDLAEIRTIAVEDGHQGARRRAPAGRRAAGHGPAARVSAGCSCSPSRCRSSPAHGFEEIKGEAATPEVYAELLRSYDEGVAEFLDLDRVKPNTLGNTRMLLRLTGPR